MLNLVALRPDPDAGRHKMMALRLMALEKLAEVFEVHSHV